MQLQINLHRHFEDKFEELKAKYGDKMLELNGFGPTMLNYTKFIDNFVDKQGPLGDTSIDSNANAPNKDIVTLTSEAFKPHAKLLGFNKVYYELEKKFGKKIADDWFEAEWNGAFYMHDASSVSFKSYCYSYDIDRLTKEGLYFVAGFKGGAPKHLVTFTDFVAEFVSFASNRTSGAVGLASFLVYSYYFWKKDVENGYFVKSPEYYRDQEFQRIIYKLNQPYLRVDQSSFTNFSIYDRPYYTAIFGGKTFPDGSFMIDAMEEVIEYQKAFMRVLSKVRSQNMMTFPVMSICLLFQDGKFVDEPFARWASKHNMKWADSNFFTSDTVTSLSNCCRLKSDVDKMLYFNSIGGTSLEVGSIKVNTINLARIAYESEGDREKYIEILKERVILCLHALDRVRHIILRNVDKGLLPNYDHGLINIEKQYVTVGLNGLYEAVKYFGLIKEDQFGKVEYTEEGLAFADEILRTISKIREEYVKPLGYMANNEQIPGERAAAINQQKDKLLFPHGIYDLPLYGNQWLPLGYDSTIKNKVCTSGVLDQSCDGGSIAHINLDAPLTDEEQAWELLNYAAKQNLNYWAFCLRISACKNNHGFYGETCPHCGEPKHTTYQRVVGSRN